MKEHKSILSLIDYALLKPTVTEEDVARCCQEAKKYGFASVCVPPFYVSLAKSLLRGSNVKVCSVIGFPFGYSKPETKVFEAERAIQDGADEIDMVINIGAMKSGRFNIVQKEIQEVAEIAKKRGVLLKVIIEACYLSDEEKEKACMIAKEAGADFIKTTTGFGPSGATVHDVKLIRKVVGSDMGVKAAGGIRTLKDVIRMIEAGANRIGTSHAVSIAEEVKATSCNIRC